MSRHISRNAIWFLIAIVPSIVTGADLSEGCIGGKTCRGKRIVVPLEPRPVTAISFIAHDAIGSTSEGKLRIRIDDQIVESYLDVLRRARSYDLTVDSLRGRQLIIEPANDDEVDVREISVRYGSASNMQPRTPPRVERPPTRDRAWTSYKTDGRCIGGSECRANGSRIVIRLENDPVLAVRFRAHDAIGTRAEGKLNVEIDSESVAYYEDVPRDGRLFEYDLPGVPARKLTIEAATDDEVNVSDIEVMYDRRGNWWEVPTPEPQRLENCIGGEQCGGSSASIRIRLTRRPVREVSFRAHDRVGGRSDGRLRIRIDDQVIAAGVDVPKDGQKYRFSVDGVTGHELIIEPDANDEVVVEGIDVRYRQ